MLTVQHHANQRFVRLHGEKEAPQRVPMRVIAAPDAVKGAWNRRRGHSYGSHRGLVEGVKCHVLTVEHRANRTFLVWGRVGEESAWWKGAHGGMLQTLEVGMSKASEW